MSERVLFPMLIVGCCSLLVAQWWRYWQDDDVKVNRIEQQHQVSVTVRTGERAIVTIPFKLMTINDGQYCHLFIHVLSLLLLLLLCLINTLSYLHQNSIITVQPSDASSVTTSQSLVDSLTPFKLWNIDSPHHMVLKEFLLHS